jgi:transcription antitermination protein NusB
MGLAQRRKARTLLVQMFYQWQYTKASFVKLKNVFSEENEGKSYDRGYFNEIMEDLVRLMDSVEEVVNGFMRKKVANITSLMLAVTRLAIYELKYRPDVPGNVIVEEGIRVSKIFGNPDDVRIIHAVLVQLKEHLRADTV